MWVGRYLGRVRRATPAPVAGSIVGVSLVLLLSPERVHAEVPQGFDDQLMGSVRQPVALASMRDGRLLVTSKLGVLHVIDGGELLPEPALDISANSCSDSERGLVGAAVDPHFETNGHVYL